jgi:cyclic pyranopterin phosphate synthase
MMQRKDYELRIAVTAGCNMNCVYCNPGISSGEMSDDELFTILRSAAKSGLHKIKWTGGEPTIRKNFPQIVEFARFIGFDDQSMTTNGLNMLPMAQVLKDAGIGKVNVSIDALDASRFKAITGQDKLELVINSVFKVADVFKYVGLNSVVIRDNAGDVSKIIGLAQKVAPDCEVRIKFLEMLPDGNRFAGNDSKDREKFVPAMEIIQLLSQEGELSGGRFEAGEEFKHITYKYKINGKRGDYLIVPLRTENGECVRGACRKIRINPTGKASPCNSAMHLVRNFASLAQERADAQMEALVSEKEAMDYEGLDCRRRNYGFWRFGREAHAI